MINLLDLLIKNSPLIKNNIARGRVKIEKIKSASLEKIEEVNENLNDSNSDIVKVLNWACVVDKNKYKKGNIIVFVRIDSLIPIKRWSNYLDKDIKFEEIEGHFKTSTIKIRGSYSQGVILPLDILPEDQRTLPIGSDLSNFLNIKKFQKSTPVRFSEDIIGEFPTYLCAKTDEVNGFDNQDLVNLVLQNKLLTITQKLDGCSSTVIIKNKEIKYVCSRSSILKNNGNVYWEAAKKINVENIPKGIFIIQGELMGLSTSPINQLNLKTPELFIYQIKHNNEFFNYEKMKNFSENILNLKCVPLVGEFNTEKSKIDIKFLQNLANHQILYTGHIAEGIVVRPHDYPQGGDGRPLSFKILNRKYLY